MLEITTDRTWILKKDFVLKNLDLEKGPFWLFNIQNGSYFELNKTAYFILSCFDRKNTLISVLDTFISKYSEIHKDILNKDFIEIADHLIAKNIITSNKNGEGI